jgi:tsukushi (leucine-rich repeat-containing protein 54)
MNLSHNRLGEASISAFTTHSHGRALHVDLSNNLIHLLVPYPAQAGLPAPCIQNLNLAWNQSVLCPISKTYPCAT